MSAEYRELAERAEALGFEMRLSLLPKDTTVIAVTPTTIVRVVRSVTDIGDLGASLDDMDAYLTAVEAERAYKNRWPK